MKGIQSILYPGNQREWELWSAGKGSSAPEKTAPEAGELVGGLGPTIVALPAETCRTLGFSFPVAENDLVEDLIQTQLEKRGLHRAELHGGGRRVQNVLREAGRTVVSVDLVDTLPEEICFPSAVDYLAAARLHEYPPKKLVIFPQHGRLVMAAGLMGQLVHCHAFSHGLDLPAEAGQEIMLTSMTLQNSGVLPEIDGLELWGDFSDADEAKLAEQTGLPVVRKALGTPSAKALTSGATPLLPESVRSAKSRKARLRKILLFSALALIAYAGLVYYLWDKGERQSERAQQLAVQEEELSPKADKVRESIAKWNAFKPVLNTQRYPIVILSEITKVMPPSGVMVREYDTGMTSVQIQGRSKDTRSAHQFLEDIKASETLALFDWSMNPPKVEGDNTARFDIRGKIAE